MTTKDRLLKILKDNCNKWVSGEFVSGELNVTRAAVSKHIATLKKSGYEIESVQGKGYLFTDSDLLMAEEFEDIIDTSVMGKNIVFFDETDSTNIRARVAAEDGLPEGTVVIAESQSMGRGRKGRSWHTDRGNGIFMSIILRPDLAPSEVAITTLMTAVAMAEAVKKETGVKADIKWPNDLLVNGRKVCGILTELSTEMDRVNYIIVGIGINVNSRIESFPDEIKDIATSLQRESGKIHLRKNIAASFFNRFEFYYELLKKRDTNSILTEWKKNTNTLKRKVEIDLPGRIIRGVVEDIDDNGILIVKTESGDLEQIISGDVRFL